MRINIQSVSFKFIETFWDHLNLASTQEKFRRFSRLWFVVINFLFIMFPIVSYIEFIKGVIAIRSLSEV